MAATRWSSTPTAPRASVGGQLKRLSSDTYQITWNTGEVLTVKNEGSYLDLKVGLGSNNTPGSVIGLLGPDLGQSQDFQLPNGTVLPQPLTSTELYGFANFWRVPQQLSLFDYPPGEDTSNFTDLGYPTAPILLADFPAFVQAQAAAAVAAAGITDPGAAAAAAFDYIASGGDVRVLTADQQLFQGLGTTSADVTPTAPAGPLLGVIAETSEVPVANAGPTAVTFDVYLTAAASTDTTVDYAVIAPDAGDLDAAAFGGTLPTGVVTIAAGDTRGQFTIEIPQGALGAAPEGNSRSPLPRRAGYRSWPPMPRRRSPRRSPARRRCRS